MINTVIKRNGIEVKFEKEKISRAIKKAFDAAGKYIIPMDLQTLTHRICEDLLDKTTVEEIQNKIEEVLVENKEYEVVKAFILYRNQHTEDRETADKVKFLTEYCKASNAASGSKYDANANVDNKNITTLVGELPKASFIRLNRKLLVDKIKELYGKELANKYLDLLNKHFIYKNDETSIYPYCASVTMYPWLLNGTKGIGGNSTAPTNLKSFCGGFINMVFIVSSMLSGAVATGEWLTYLTWFIQKEYGKDYYKHSDDIVDLSIKKRTIDKIITDCFEQIVYSLNQPTGARNFQAVFWNISYFDKYYFNALFENFYFPDGTQPDWEAVSWLQKRFMKWFNKERTKTVLTFPVETMAMLTENGKPKDEEWADFAAEMYAEGHSFFTYMSDRADSLSSCCRLRNEIQDNEFSYTLGAGGISTGSKSVLTININRCVQHAVDIGVLYTEYLKEVVDLCHKVQIAYNENIKTFLKYKMLPLYDTGYININRQYLTIGVNGIVEAAEYLGIPINVNDEYKNFVQNILGVIEKKNKEYRTKELMFNCEMIPAENVGVKHAKWDKEDGYKVNRDCYNSYFYKVEDDSISVIDKFKLHGKDYIEHLTGGSALHMNLDSHLSKAQYKQLFNIAATEGCNYFTFNIPNTLCNSCGHIDKRYLKECPECGSKDVDYLTRIIGYLRKISNFSEARQKEASKRVYSNGKEQI